MASIRARLRRAVNGAVPAILATLILGAPAPAAAGERVSEVMCLAQTIYFESRGEPQLGQVAVAHVVLNRVGDGRFPGSICRVVRQGGDARRYRCQFTWWCDGLSDRPRSVADWHSVLVLALDVYLGRSEDPTAGALWYHADYVSPHWRSAFARGPKIGKHIFYREFQQTAQAD